MPPDRGLDMSAAEAALGAKRSRGMVKSVVGKTLINAELIFNAGVRTLPISAGVIGEKSTEVLKKKISRKSPPASKPGEPPRQDTGDLIQSIQYNVMKSPRRSATTGTDERSCRWRAIKVVITRILLMLKHLNLVRRVRVEDKQCLLGHSSTYIPERRYSITDIISNIKKIRNCRKVCCRNVGQEDLGNG